MSPSDPSVPSPAGRRRGGWTEPLRGARAVLPILVGVIPFALVLGFIMRQTGRTSAESGFFSFSLIAGTAQVATVHLFAAGAPLLVIIATTVMINMRYALYSLSLVPILQRESWWRRLFCAYIISDQSYAFTMAEAERNPDNSDITGFLIGASLGVFLPWAAAVLIGYHAGAVIPPSLPLDFTIPLVFTALLAPQLKDRGRIASALTAAAAAVILIPTMPLQLGFLAALLAGVVVGVLLDEKREGA